MKYLYNANQHGRAQMDTEINNMIFSCKEFAIGFIQEVYISQHVIAPHVWDVIYEWRHMIYSQRGGNSFIC